MTTLASNPLQSLGTDHSRVAAAQRAAAPRALVSLVLGALVAALAVAADHWVGTWGDQHFVAAGMVLWAVVFGGTLLLARPARRVAQAMMGGLNTWARRQSEARAEALLMRLARRDSRIMADIQAAQDRAESDDHGDWADALAPLGQDVTPPRNGWLVDGLRELLARVQSRNMSLLDA